MPHTPHSDRLETLLVDLCGGDPFAHVRRASDEHREAHGPDCGAYPSGPIKMRLLSTFVRACGAKRILEIGCGLGYSALWLVDAAGQGASVETIDRFPEHVALARRFAADAGYADRLQVIEGEGVDVLATLAGPYDLVHDDGWFAREPPFVDRMIALLRAGGLLAMSNWFLLEEALTDEPSTDWTGFAGPQWADDVRTYARTLASHPQLTLAFTANPWLGLAVKVA